MPIDEPNPRKSLIVDITNNDENEVARLSLKKLPPVWRKNINVWFMQVEAIFRTSRITTENTKFDFILSTLDADIAEMISDFLTRPRSDTPYTDLKERLIQEFQETDQRRTTRLLTELELGDKKPTQLLREMRSLAGENVRDDFLRTMFIQHLPVHVRSILASSSDTLDQLAIMADKIREYSPQQYSVNPVETSSSTQANQPGQDRISRLEAQISALTTAIHELKSHHSRSRSPSRSQSSTRSRSRSNTRTFLYTDPTFCYFHRLFGNKARKCEPDCKFVQKSGN